ncbi:hypothetical protein J3A83DRAFT_4185237 [Scleroderma citrinum]
MAFPEIRLVRVAFLMFIFSCLITKATPAKLPGVFGFGKLSKRMCWECNWFIWAARLSGFWVVDMGWGRGGGGGHDSLGRGLRGKDLEHKDWAGGENQFDGG